MSSNIHIHPPPGAPPGLPPIVIHTGPQPPSTLKGLDTNVYRLNKWMYQTALSALLTTDYRTAEEMATHLLSHDDLPHIFRAGAHLVMHYVQSASDNSATTTTSAPAHLDAVYPQISNLNFMLLQSEKVKEENEKQVERLRAWCDAAAHGVDSKGYKEALEAEEEGWKELPPTKDVCMPCDKAATAGQGRVYKHSPHT